MNWGAERFHNTLKIDSQTPGKTTTTFKFKKGEKIFHIKVEDSDVEDGHSEDLDGELTLIGQVVNKHGAAEGRKPKKYPQKDCPLKCVRRHPNGSGFFCRIFQAKTMEERKTLCRNANLCILCLAVKNKAHTCVVQSCPRCFAAHKRMKKGLC